MTDDKPANPGTIRVQNKFKPRQKPKPPSGRVKQGTERKQPHE